MNRLRGTCRPDASLRSCYRQRGPLVIIVYAMAICMGAVDPACPNPCHFNGLPGAARGNAGKSAISAPQFRPGNDPADDDSRSAIPCSWISGLAGDGYGSYPAGRIQEAAATSASLDLSQDIDDPDAGKVTICDGAYSVRGPPDWLENRVKGVPSGFHTPPHLDLASFRYAGSRADDLPRGSEGGKWDTWGEAVLLRGWQSEPPAERRAAETGEPWILPHAGGLIRDDFAGLELSEPERVDRGDGVGAFLLSAAWWPGEAWGSPHATGALSLLPEPAGREDNLRGWFFAFGEGRRDRKTGTGRSAGFHYAWVPAPSTLLLLGSALVGLLLLGRFQKKGP